MAKKDYYYHYLIKLENFPQDSVPVKVSLNKIQRIYDPFIPAIAGDGAGEAGHPREFYPSNPTKATLDSIARGEVLYNTYCAACHGVNGEGGVGPKLQGQTNDAIVSMLTQYKNGETRGAQSALMWGQSAALSAEDMANIGAFVESL